MTSLSNAVRRLWSLALAAPLAAALALPLAGTVHADQRDFTLVNNSSAVLTHLYVSPSAAAAWGDDVLGKDVMLPGENALIYFQGFDGATCSYDILTRFEDGGEGRLNSVDLCATDTVTFSDGQ